MTLEEYTAAEALRVKAIRIGLAALGLVVGLLVGAIVTGIILHQDTNRVIHQLEARTADRDALVSQLEASQVQLVEVQDEYVDFVQGQRELADLRSEVDTICMESEVRLTAFMGTPIDRVDSMEVRGRYGGCVQRLMGRFTTPSGAVDYTNIRP